jgi:hypothetical protein
MCGWGGGDTLACGGEAAGEGEGAGLPSPQNAEDCLIFCAVGLWAGHQLL